MLCPNGGGGCGGGGGTGITQRLGTSGGNPCATCEAVLNGSAHVIYGLTISAGCFLLSLFTKGTTQVLLLIIGFAGVVGSMADLFAHGYTH